MAPAGSQNAPEARARRKIDGLLEQAGWTLRDRDEMNVSVPAIAGVQARKGHGYADHLLFLDGKAVGVCEAKPAGIPLRNVEVQKKKYVDGLPPAFDAP